MKRIGTARIREEIGRAASTLSARGTAPLEPALARMVGRKRRAAVPRAPSEIEEMFAVHVRASDLPAPAREYQFDTARRWRFDFAWPDAMIAVEVEGGTHAGGRHTRGDGYARDCEKYNAAALAGWRLLRFPGEHVRSGVAIATVLRAFGRAS